MPHGTHPRSGSLQVWPRKKAKRIYPKVNPYTLNSSSKLLSFAGYKVGMTHALYLDSNPTSPTKNEQVFSPVTIVECPPIKVFGIRFYQKDPNYGSSVLYEKISAKLDKELVRKINIPKKFNEKSIDETLNKSSEVRLLVHTQPKLTTIGKKVPEIFEIAIAKDDAKAQYEYASSLFEKEINIPDVFKEGQFIDIHAVTKGKGFQGTVKRFGVKLKDHKSEKKKRSVGNLGPLIPSKVLFTVPQTGQMGYHTRTELNKLILKISNNPKELETKQGYKHYGLIKNDFILIKGSIPGVNKRLIRFTEARRNKKQRPLQLSFIRT